MASIFESNHDSIHQPKLEALRFSLMRYIITFISQLRRDFVGLVINTRFSNDMSISLESPPDERISIRRIIFGYKFFN